MRRRLRGRGGGLRRLGRRRGAGRAGGRRLGGAAVHHLDDVETVAALDQAADLAFLQIADGLNKQVGPAVQRAHTHDATLQGFGTVRGRGGQAGEVIATLGLRQQAFGLLAQHRQLLGRRTFRHAHQNLGQGVEHRARRRSGLLGFGLRLGLRLRGCLRRGAERRIAPLVLQKRVDFGVGNHNRGIHRALTQAIRADLVAQRLAITVPARAGSFDFLA